MGDLGTQDEGGGSTAEEHAGGTVDPSAGDDGWTLKQVGWFM